jgi:hypothetical protein
MTVMGGLWGAIQVMPTAAANLPSSYTALTKHFALFGNLKFNQVLQFNSVSGKSEISQGCKFGSGCTVFQGCSMGTINSPFAYVNHTRS